MSNPASYPQEFRAAATLKIVSLTSSCAFVVCARELPDNSRINREMLVNWSLDVRIPPKSWGNLVYSSVQTTVSVGVAGKTIISINPLDDACLR